MKQFQQEKGISLSKDRLALQRLKEAAEKAKCELSAMDTTELNLPFIAADATGPKHLVTTLARPGLENMIAEIIARTRKPCQEALKIAGLDPSEIDEVLLVGGQTRTPLVIQTVKEIFGKEPRRDKNPDEVVGLGAALQAGIIKGDVKEIVLLDAIPLSLGVVAKGNLFVKIIERGSAIPTQKSRIFTTVADNQDTVEVHVRQGEREIASENISLGKFDLVGIPPAPKGVPQIEVNFEVNANGIVSVSAKDLVTQNQQKIVVNPSSGLTEDEISRIVDEAKAKEQEDRSAVEFERMKLKLERLLDNTNKAFTEFGSILNKVDRERIDKVIKEAFQSMASSNMSRLQESLNKLSTVSRSLSEVILLDPKTSSMSQPPTDGGSKPS
jgi:molecular chaperone DnaK